MGGAIASALGIEAIWGYIINIFLSAALSYAANALFGPDYDDREIGDMKSGGHLKAKRSTRAILPLIYGTCRVGVNQVYVGTSGSDNEHLHIVGVLGEGPVNGIHQEASVDQVFLDDKIYTDYGSEVYYEFFTGTSTQNVCSTLNTAIPTWTDPLRYTAYIYMRLEYNREKFNGIPNITVIVEGLQVWDPTDLTTAYSANPALWVYDMLTRPSVRGGFGLDVWYGPEPATPRIDNASVDDAKDYCTAKAWTGGFPLTENKAVMDNMNLVLSNFRGALIYSENTFKLLYRDLNYESVVMSFDDDDVISNGVESSLEISQPNIFNRPNAVRAKFLSEDGATDGSGKYQMADLVKTDSTAITADGDYRETEINLYALNTVEKTGKMLNYHLERLRWGKTVSFTAGGKALALEPMDLIQLTHTMPGWTNQQLRVIAASYNDANTVGLVAIEESLDLYDDTYDVTTHDWYQTNLPNILGPVASVINVSHAETVYYYRERSFTRWKIDFDPPAAATYPWWDYAEIWLSIGGTSDYRYMTKSTSDYILDPVEEGEIYYVKMRSVSVSGAKEDFDSCYTVSKTIVGKTTAPSSLASMTALANGDSVSLYATAVTDPDIEAYETRLGDAWADALFLRITKNCTLSFNGVRPGTHTFWMSPVDNSGQYSATPVSASVLVFLPPSYTVLATYGTWTWDFSAGTFCNMERYTDGVGTDHLRLIVYEDRLTDGGFELGDFSGWTAQGSSSIESTEVYEETYSSTLVATGAANVDGCYETYELNPLASYEFIQFVYVSALTTGDFLACRMAFYDATPTFISETSIAITATNGDWTEYTRTIGPAGSGADFTIPVNARYVRIYGGGQWYNAGSNPSGTAYTDSNHFKLTTVQAIVNGNCEQTTPALPTFWGTALTATNGTAVRSTTQADTGTYSISFTGDGTTAAAHEVIFDLSRSCPLGVNYTISVRVYIPSGNTVLDDLELFIQKTHVDGMETWVSLGSTTATDTWTALSGLTVLTADEYLSGVRVYNATATATSEIVYIDNLSALQSQKLVGKWISPNQNFTAIEDVRVWGNFVTSFVSGETTFGGVFGLTDTFGDHDADTKSFAEIFTPTQASRLDAVLLHKENIGYDWSEKGVFQLLCAEVQAQYVAVEATITNPSNTAHLYLEELDMLAYEGPVEV